MTNRAAECPFRSGLICPVRAAALERVQAYRAYEEMSPEDKANLLAQGSRHGYVAPIPGFQVPQRPVEAEKVLELTRAGNCDGTVVEERRLFPGLFRVLGHGAQVVKCGHEGVPPEWRDATSRPLPPAKDD